VYYTAHFIWYLSGCNTVWSDYFAIPLVVQRAAFLQHHLDILEIKKIVHSPVTFIREGQSFVSL
jgi:hypothetical protein